MNRLPVILFDVMETLVTEPFFTAMPEFFGMTLDELLAEKHPTSWIEFEKGLLTETEYLDQFFLDRRSVDGDGLRNCLQQSYEWIAGMEELLAQLAAQGYEIHALSNYPVWYRLIDDTLQLSRYLHWTFVSCRTGIRKPHPRAYLSAAESLGKAPSHCLFIDDRQENVRAAANVGMDAILMTGADDVRRELVQRSLLPR